MSAFLCQSWVLEIITRQGSEQTARRSDTACEACKIKLRNGRDYTHFIGVPVSPPPAGTVESGRAWMTATTRKQERIDPFYIDNFLLTTENPVHYTCSKRFDPFFSHPGPASRTFIPVEPILFQTVLPDRFIRTEAPEVQV